MEVDGARLLDCSVFQILRFTSYGLLSSLLLLSWKAGIQYDPQLNEHLSNHMMFIMIIGKGAISIFCDMYLNSSCYYFKFLQGSQIVELAKKMVSGSVSYYFTSQ